MPDLTRRDFISLAALAAGTLTAGRRTSAADALVPADKKLTPEWLASVTARGTRTAWRGAELDYVGLPVGGLGAGQLYLGGDGRLWHWDIFNHTEGTGDGHYANPPKPASPLDQGFALEVVAGGRAQTRRLDRDGFADISFTPNYPLPTVDYRDPDCPVTVSLEAGAPFLPLDVADSELPATLLAFTLRNTGDAPAEVELAGWLQNAVCLHSAADWEVRRANRIVRDGALLFLECFPAPPKPVVGATRPLMVFEDFEGETYGAWTTTGTAFGTAPSRKAGHDQRLTGYVGKGLANSYPESDEPQGTLTSPEFTIGRRFVSFLIGGGNHPGQECINLLVDGKVVRTATGKNTDAMEWASWNVGELEGRRARIEIVDHFSGGWGHIDIDEIEFADQPRRGNGKLEEEADWGTMGLALLEARPDDHAHAALPAPGVPAGLFPSQAGAEDGPVEASAEHVLRGALSRRLTLAPGASATVTFAVVWHFGNLSADGVYGKVGRHYATRFADARAVAGYLSEHGAELLARTRLFRDTWYDSTLPYWLLDRSLYNASTLASGTAQRWANGRLWGWEGVGCCVGTCTHVWHYAQAAARLFPELERGMRELQDFGPGFDPASGQVGNRGEWDRRAAVDGHSGTILRVLREHQMSADDAFLRRLWPKVKLALDWLMGQDGKGSGVIEGAQPNTLDADWFGPVPWLSSLYLAALRAGEAMALEVGDADQAAKCRAILAAGGRHLEERLFNGEYFIQILDPAHAKNVGSGLGCEIDQVFGQHWCRMVGVAPVLDEAKVKSALRSIYTYNFAPDVGPYRAANKPGRWYAMPGEAGLLMCTFPKGGEAEACGHPPVWSAMYFNECMNGFEHQAAAHMIWEGMVTEGLTVARALHERYAPAKRNPFNEVECGDHYARSMASYDLFLAAAGFECHGPKGHIGFSPRLTPEQFRCAFTAAEGWGSFAQTRGDGRQTMTLSVKWGRLRLKTFACSVAGAVATVSAKVDGQPVPAEVRVADGRAVTTFGREVVLATEQTLSVELA